MTDSGMATAAPSLSGPASLPRDLLVSLSLAGLMLLSAADRILALPVKYLHWQHLLQLVIGIVGLTLALTGLRRASRRPGLPGWIAMALFIGLPLLWMPDTLTSVEGVTAAYLWVITRLGQLGLDLFPSRTLVFLLVLTGLAGFALLIIRTRARSWVEPTLIVLATLPVLLTLQVFLRLGSHSTPSLDPTHQAPRRVVWLVFDELDQGVLVSQLPTLPAFRALSEQGLVATRAQAPANYTDLSLPSLWTGATPFDASASSRGGLLIKPTRQAAWSRTWLRGNTVFSHLHALGAHIHIIGWHLPYCTLFPDQPGLVSEDSSRFTAPGPGQNIFSWMVRDNLVVNQLYALYAHRFRADPERYTSYLERQPKGHLGRRLFEVVESQEAALDGALGNPSADLVFGHLGVPHLPLSTSPTPVEPGPLDEDYRANLGRCDRFLDRTILPLVRDPKVPTLLIVTSDHWFRFRAAKDGSPSASPRRPIPFLVLLTGAKDLPPAPYQRSFNTRRTRDLVESFLGGSVQSYDDVRQVLDRWPDSETRILAR